jgi:hypothetical protein
MVHGLQEGQRRLNRRRQRVILDNRAGEFANSDGATGLEREPPTSTQSGGGISVRHSKETVTRIPPAITTAIEPRVAAIEITVI